MKKAVVAALGILIVISIFLVLPAIQGIRVESRIRDRIQPVNKALGQEISVKIKSYERGWFRSHMRIACAIGSDGKNAWIIPVDVIHGPFPIAEIIKGKMALRFFEAQLESRFTPAISDTVVQRAFEKATEPLVNLSATFSANGSVRMSMTSPALSIADKNFGWKGASISLASREKPRNIKINARLAGFSLRNANRDLKLKAGEVKWFFRAFDSYASLESDLNIENFYREHEGSIFEIRKLKARVKTDRGRHKLHYGNSSASIRKLRVKAPKWGVDWTVNKFLLHTSSNLVEDKYDVMTQGRAQELTTPDMIIGPLGYSWAIRDVDPAAFYLAVSRFESERETDSNAKKQSSEKDQGCFFDFVRSFLSKGSPRIEGLVNIKDRSRRGKIGVHLIIDGERAASIDSFGKLPDVATGNINLRFSTGLLTELWKTGTGIVATVTESELIGDPARIESEAEMHISKLLKSKLLVQKEESYVSKFYLNRGTITVNRLPFDILRILADVMAKDPSEITVDFGKLGVRGGLQLSDVRGPVATLNKGLKSCVQKEIDNGQGHPRGVVHVKWKISDTGQSESPNIVYSTVVTDTLEACVVSLFSSLKFPTSERKSRALLVIGFALPDIVRPRAGLKFGTLHHYKNPFPVGTAYTIGPASVE